MLWRYLFLLSALLIGGAILARGWFGKRVLAERGGKRCRANPSAWPQEDIALLPAGDATASDCGRALRLAALARWKRNDPNAARARDASLRFGLGVPPLTLVVVIFAVAVAKLPLFGGLAVILAATALSTLFGLLSLGAELRAVASMVRHARERHLFPRSEDEDAACACAEAEVWMNTLPPILRYIS